MNRIKLISIHAFCICILAVQVSAQTAANDLPKADPRVAKALKEANTEFEIASHDGSYKVTYGTKGNRRQTGIVASMTEDVNGVEMRAVLSLAMVSEKPPTLPIALLLLKENVELAGGWSLLKTDNKYAIIISIYIPANSTGKSLDQALQDIVIRADEMEERLTKKDDN